MPRLVGEFDFGAVAVEESAGDELLRVVGKRKLAKVVDMPREDSPDKRLAADALAQREGSVTDIAHACGFRDPLYFSRVFKARYGVAPSFYAQRIKDA